MSATAATLANAQRPRHERWGRWWRRHGWGYLFLLPQTLVFAVFFLLPVLAAFALAFLDYRPNSVRWVGLDNFHTALTDPLMGQALRNTALYTLVVVSFWLGKALLIAYLIDPLSHGLQTFYKSAFYLPAVTSSIIISLVWLWIYNPTFGLLNAGLLALGMEPVAWLGNTRTALPALMAIQIVMGGGSSIVLLSAALARIPRDLYEVALVDGARRPAIFRHVILPLIRPTLLYLVVTGTINTFQVFEAVYVMTQGGPQFATTTVVYRIYQEAFQRFHLGVASAQAILLFLVTFALAAVQFRWLGQNVEY